ncbi:MAG: ParB/RepB/Spo0J family partition protein [Proteobacteria bacterium]|nr:ParB/RepB/Spo0J family partition protein [Pseudomonadota bacterium]MBU1639209.1 ParB/RepB/Spo0J family partition protein [Pseudomonadota bacterium]
MSSGDRLGRGLGALLADDNDKLAAEGEYILCDITAIDPNPYQPRHEMDVDALQELAESIAEKGILQPLVVTPSDVPDRYILIAGERRLRASKLAGLTDVPVIVRDVETQDRLELALIENIQRENLNPIDEGLAYQQLVKEFSMTQEEVAKRVGKERSTVANTMRLLQLPDFIKDDIGGGRLSMGHARVLLAIKDHVEVKEIRDKIINKELSVRQTEALVRAAKQKNSGNAGGLRRSDDKKPIPPSYCRTLTNDFIRHFGTKSKITQNGDRGKIEIEYYSLDDLERIHSLISKLPLE